MKKIIFFALVAFLFLAKSVSADVWVSDSMGAVKRTFYQNDTVYLNSTPLFTASTTLRVYIVNDNNTWINQTNLTDVRGIYGTVSTDSTGAINRPVIWSPTMTMGKYDVIVDVNSNGVYDAGTCGTSDCVYHLTETGFEIFRTPRSIITASFGPYTPVNHNWAYDPNNPYNVMMQLKLTGDTGETVKINSIYLTALGGGDDRKGISIIRIVQDFDSNGVYNAGDGLMAWGTFFGDDGIASLGFQTPYNLPANGTVYFLIIYTMSSYVKDGDTYAAKITDIEATGDLTKVKTVVNNLPLMTSTKTIVASPYQTTTTTTTATVTTTTTTILADECSARKDCKQDYCSEKKMYSYSCEYDSAEKRKVCKISSASVKCCEDKDCGQGEQCVNYACEKKINLEMTVAVVSVIALGILIPILYFYIKSRRGAEYEYTTS